MQITYYATMHNKHCFILCSNEMIVMTIQSIKIMPMETVSTGVLNSVDIQNL